MKSMDEIKARLKELEDGTDFFGVYRETLLMCLPYEDVKNVVKAGTTELEWESACRLREDDLREGARTYLRFAFSKVVGERGLSASRSVDHYRAWVWLLGTDEDVEKLESASYGWYGDTQLAQAVVLLGLQGEWNSLCAEIPEFGARFDTLVVSSDA